ncbi:response regulator [Shimazuella sp. AN120528]|uniref:response regulator n=1 Tax=Shimazuella soli TaxID=1892854 RepID=UPI001F0DD87E|nr:response regulator [Shimazuella soli]MCH5584835.1 response regulator [Shimazuella soli]
MLFYIVDDDEAIRSMLDQIIEDEDLGRLVGEAEDGSQIDGPALNAKNIDILIIDLLMPNQDGIQTIRKVKPSFKGKIIMLSQVESKELIGEAYSLGLDYYITKPINKMEVVSVIQKVMERIRLEKSIQDIRKSLGVLDIGQVQVPKADLRVSGNILLSELGLAGKSGSTDLLDIIDYLFYNHKDESLKQGFPALKEIFFHVAKQKLGDASSDQDIKKEVKASEQRVRRAIYQSLKHIASLGLTDFSNWTFENYASKFFDFASVREMMTAEQKGQTLSNSTVRVNTKKFIQVFYFEVVRLHTES